LLGVYLVNKSLRSRLLKGG